MSNETLHDQTAPTREIIRRIDGIDGIDADPDLSVRSPGSQSAW